MHWGVEAGSSGEDGPLADSTSTATVCSVGDLTDQSCASASCELVLSTSVSPAGTGTSTLRLEVSAA